MILIELPQSEWPRLTGVGTVDGEDLGKIAAACPADARLVVVEDGGLIVGSWAVMPYVHVEGLWIHPLYRKQGSVGRRLLTGMRQIAARWGVRAVLTGCSSDEVRLLLEKVGGVKLPDHYVFPLIFPRGGA